MEEISVWQVIGGAVLGFIAANIINFFELRVVLEIMKDVKTMLKQMKAEGKDDKWLE